MNKLKNYYNLHKLGWKGFQDLAICIAEVYLDKPIQTFSETHDSGMDGLYRGKKTEPNSEHLSIIQCKYNSNGNTRFSNSKLKNELEKLEKIASEEKVGDYTLITNYSVSGKKNNELRARIEKIIEGKFEIYGVDWITRQIQGFPKLRSMVPRVYGLGDLSKILDDRIYQQADSILKMERENLARFVQTEAYYSCQNALENNKYVMLIGEPASGKTTICSALAFHAIDNWECKPIYVTNPSDFKKHLDLDQSQLFVVDNAWGVSQFQDHLVDEWNQNLPLFQSAINNETWIIFTARNHIWNSARKSLSRSNSSLLKNSLVSIDVQKYDSTTRAQILYNHLKFGKQPKSMLTEIKPFLPAVVETSLFLTESARRFGDPIYTNKINLNQRDIIRFFENPSEILQEIINELPNDLLASIALIFISGDRLISPIEDTKALELVNKLYGVDQSQIISALNHLESSFVKKVTTSSGYIWQFKHPTIGESFSQIIAKDSEFIELYLRGAKLEGILNEVVCKSKVFTGTRVVVAEQFYKILIDRMQSTNVVILREFISNRADKNFTSMLLTERVDIITEIKYFSPPISEDPDTKLLLQLHKFECLPGSLRRKFFKCIKVAIISEADISYLTDDEIQSFLSEREKTKLNQIFEKNVIKCISNHVDRIKESASDFDELKRTFYDFEISVSTFLTQVNLLAKYPSILAKLTQEREKIISKLKTTPISTISNRKVISEPILQPEFSEIESENPLVHIFSDLDK